MKPMSAAAALLCAGAMLLPAGASHAQDPGVVTPLDQVFSQLDTNNDGVISLSEADRSVLLSSNFARADTDADNAIDRMEFGAFQALISGSPGGGGGLVEGTITSPEATADTQAPEVMPPEVASPGTGSTVPPAADSSAPTPPTAVPGAEAQPFAAPGTAGATPPTTSSPGATPPTFSAPGRTPPTSSPGVTPAPP